MSTLSLRLALQQIAALLEAGDTSPKTIGMAIEAMRLANRELEHD